MRHQLVLDLSLDDFAGGRSVGRQAVDLVREFQPPDHPFEGGVAAVYPTPGAQCPRQNLRDSGKGSSAPLLTLICRAGFFDILCSATNTRSQDARRKVTALEISFDTLDLRNLCEVKASAQRALGNETAGFLKRRLADIRSADTIKDVLAGRPHELPDGTGRVAVDLSAGYRLLLCANHPQNPHCADGRPNWSLIRRVRVVSIEKHRD